MVIVGGGGHGLATAHYLVKNHGITNVAVLEKGWLAGGNMARNTTLIRSNYLWDESAFIYEHALKLWEGLEEDLGYPILFSQRGVLNLAHTEQDVRDSVRRSRRTSSTGSTPSTSAPTTSRRSARSSTSRTTSATRCSARPTSPVPASPSTTTWPGASPAAPTRPGWISSRTARCWTSSPRAPSRTGTARVTGIRTSRGDIACGQVALCAAGHTSTLLDRLGVDTPLQSHPLQALVSELLEPVHPTIVMSNAVHVYVSQAHKGELVMGAGVDSYNGYGQRGAFHIIERQMAAAVELFRCSPGAPAAQLGGHRRRHPGRVADRGPHAVHERAGQLRLGDRWVQGDPGLGWCLAHTIATDELHPHIAPFALDRFVTGALVDEHGAAGVAH